MCHVEEKRKVSKSLNQRQVGVKNWGKKINSKYYMKKKRIISVTNCEWKQDSKGWLETKLKSDEKT